MTSTATDAGPQIAGHDAEHAREEYRRLFHRYLAAWATDVLALRRTGLDRPCVRDAWSPAAPMRRAA
ncbi:MAG: hypothetical protein ACF8QF_02665 [Phycisphaerales bacterium]